MTVVSVMLYINYTRTPGSTSNLYLKTLSGDKWIISVTTHGNIRILFLQRNKEHFTYIF